MTTPRALLPALPLVLLLACSESDSSDRNPAPPPPIATSSADLNGRWVCREVIGLEGEDHMFDVDHRLVIDDDQLVEVLDGSGASVQDLGPQGEWRFGSPGWYQNIVTRIGFSFGVCTGFRTGGRVQAEVCFGWRFALVGRNRLVGYVARKWIVPSDRPFALALVTLQRVE